MAKPDNAFDIQFLEGVLRRSPGNREAVEILGGLYTKQGRIDDGLKMDRKMVRLAPDNPTAHYNLACSLALKQRKADAVKALRRAVDAGYRDAAWMRKDPDLKSLRQHAGYREILTRLTSEPNLDEKPVR